MPRSTVDPHPQVAPLEHRGDQGVTQLLAEHVDDPLVVTDVEGRHLG